MTYFIINKIIEMNTLIEVIDPCPPAVRVYRLHTTILALVYPDVRLITKRGVKSLVL